MKSKLELRIGYSCYKYNSIALGKTFSDLIYLQYNNAKEIFCLQQLYLYL